MDNINILEIPTELITLIFKHLDNNSLLQLKSTCKHFNTLTKTFGNFSVKFADNMDSNILETLLKLKIYKLVLHDIKILPILTFPQNTSQLVFRDDCRGDVLKSALINFSHASSLSFIKANSQSDAFQDEEFQNIISKFINLKYISFINCTIDMKHSEDWVMKLSKSPTLKFPKLLSFKATGFHMDTFGFYKFLSRHSETLESINLTCDGFENDINCDPNLLTPFNFSKLKNIKTSCTFSGCSWHRGIGQGVSKHNIFKSLKKKKLPYETFIQESEPIYSWNLFGELQLAKTTLKCLKISNIAKTSWHNPNRIEWLTEFVKLKTLSLANGLYPNIILEETTRVPPIYDTLRLPNTIKSLSLTSLYITKSDMLKLLEGLTNLKHLKLFGMGGRKDVISGIDSTLFIEIIQKCLKMEKFTFGRASYESDNTKRQEMQHWRRIFRLVKIFNINVVPKIYPYEIDESWNRLIFGINLFTFNLPINKINVKAFKSQCFLSKDKWIMDAKK